MLNAKPGLLSDFDIFNCYTRFHPDATSHLPQIKEISKKNFTSTSHTAKPLQLFKGCLRLVTVAKLQLVNHSLGKALGQLTDTCCNY